MEIFTLFFLASLNIMKNDCFRWNCSISFHFISFARSEIECQYDDSIEWNEIERNETKQNGQTRQKSIETYTILRCVIKHMEWNELCFLLVKWKRTSVFLGLTAIGCKRNGMNVFYKLKVWKTCVHFQTNLNCIFKKDKNVLFFIASDVFGQWANGKRHACVSKWRDNDKWRTKTEQKWKRTTVIRPLMAKIKTN